MAITPLPPAPSRLQSSQDFSDTADVFIAALPVMVDEINSTVYTANVVINVPAGNISSTDLQAVVNELDAEKVHKFAGSGTVDQGAAKIPVGTTAQRPTALAGMLRLNSDYSKPEVYNGASWSGLGGADGSGGDAIFYLNGTTVNNPFTIPVTANAHTVGAVTISAAVTVDGRWVIS